MKTTGKCPKCGKTEIVEDARMIDHGHAGIQQDMTIATYKQPKAILFKGKQTTTVSAWLCISCGFIELYADHPSWVRTSEES